jgi:ACGX-repeat protein
MGKLNFISSWTEGVSEFFAKRSAQSYMNRPMFAMAAAGCGSACGAGDKEAEEKPSACGSACGAGDKEQEPKPSACGSACGAGDK